MSKKELQERLEEIFVDNTKPRPLIEIVRDGGGLDIAAEDFDWGNYFDCPIRIEDVQDGYDACMYFFGQEINCLHFMSDWYSACDVEKFILRYLPVFRDFFNENNREGYRPMDYERADHADEDEGFYEAYIMPFESLINGNYTEDDYLELVTRLMDYKIKKEDK